MAKYKILYVEDYPVVQLMYADVLRAHFDVDVASDGKEAMEKMGSSDYDIVLLDLLLPQVGGVEFLENYRSKYPDKKARIIILSDFDNEQTIKRLQELGVEDYWMKVENTPYAVVDKINALDGEAKPAPEATGEPQ